MYGYVIRIYRTRWDSNVTKNPRWLRPSMRRTLVHHHATLRQWSTAVFINNPHDANPIVSWDMSRSSGKYEEYRDELDDYITVDD